MSNNKIPLIRFCRKYKVTQSRAETVAVADVWEEMLKYVVFAASHYPGQSFVGFLDKLLSSGISRAIETEPDPSADK